MKNEKTDGYTQALWIILKLYSAYVVALVLAMFIRSRLLIVALEPVGVLLFLSLIFVCVVKMIKENKK